MTKRMMVMAAVLVAACGTGTKDETGGDPGGPGAGAGGGTVGVAQLLDATDQVKLIVNTTRQVASPVYDDSDNVVTCAADTDCAGYTGAVCQVGQCVVMTTVAERFYAQNFAKATGPKDFKVPCDGRSYQAVVVGGTADLAGTGRKITERHVKEFTPAVGATCTIPAGWTPQTAVPAITLPAVIYGAGFPAPYNQFAVSATGLTSPWSSSNWEVTYPAAGPTTYVGSLAILPAPTGTSVTLTATFHLDASLLLGSDQADDWYLTVEAAPQAVTGSGTVPLP